MSKQGQGVSEKENGVCVMLVVVVVVGGVVVVVVGGVGEGMKTSQQN